MSWKSSFKGHWCYRVSPEFLSSMWSCQNKEISQLCFVTYFSIVKLIFDLQKDSGQNPIIYLCCCNAISVNLCDKSLCISKSV